MKAFISTLKGKLLLGGIGTAIVAATIIVVIMVTSEESYRSIKIDGLSGTTVITDESNTTASAYKGMNLKSGDKVMVEENSNMTLLFDSDKYMFADEGTKFRVEASGNDEKSNTKTRIVLEEGSVLCRIDSKLGDEETFEVETPNSVMSVRGTIFKMTIYKDEKGENYARVDVLEGSVKVDLYSENGEKTGEEGLIEAGQAATVHSNPEISEFVIGDSDISYDDFSEVMASFVIETIDDGREICIGEDLFKHYTGLENHPETATVVKEATCKEEGVQDIYCSTCDIVVRTEPIKITEHKPGEWQLKKQGTCKEKETEAIVCTVCGDEIEVRELELGNHSFGNWTVITAATCENAGSEKRTCSVCGKTETRAITATGHSYGSWTLETAATCENAGSEKRTCSGCGDTETQSIAATGHSYGSWTLETAATCENAGSEKRTCSGCGDTETQSIAATGHSYGSWTLETAATCENAGSEKCTCSGCGDTETQSIAATGHSYGAWTVTTVADCETEGSQSRTCSNCGKTENETIAALGHLVTHSSTATHRLNGTWDDCAVGDTVDIFFYVECERCGKNDVLINATGTVVNITPNYAPTFTCDVCGARG